MKKILYMCAVEWNWIAQRPQFLEIELEKYFDITVFSPVHLLRNFKNQKNTIRPKQYKEFFILPYQEKIGLIRSLSKLLFKFMARDLYRYDIIWVGCSLYEKYIPSDYKGIIVFDYMDDNISMQTDVKMKKAYAFSQPRIMERADLICVSSNYLMNLISKEYQNKAKLVRNAFRGEVIIPPHKREISSKVRIGYVGTISKWMDFELLKRCTEKYKNVEFHFWGPVEVASEQSDRFFFHGVAEHSELPKLIEDMDALHMPFIVNDIVKAVDPVKLYEYISFGKPVICIDYDEVKRFENYVWLYDSEESYFRFIEGLSENNLPLKYDSEEQKRFLFSNTWEERARIVKEEIENKKRFDKNLVE